MIIKRKRLFLGGGKAVQRGRWHWHGFRLGHRKRFHWGRIGAPERMEDGYMLSKWRRFHNAQWYHPPKEDHMRGIDYESAPGLTVSVDLERCVACGNCERTCSFGAIKVEKEIFRVDTSKCNGCGRCIEECPQGALSLKGSQEVFHQAIS